MNRDIKPMKPDTHFLPMDIHTICKRIGDFESEDPLSVTYDLSTIIIEELERLHKDSGLSKSLIVDNAVLNYRFSGLNQALDVVTAKWAYEPLGPEITGVWGKLQKAMGDNASIHKQINLVLASVTVTEIENISRDLTWTNSRVVAEALHMFMHGFQGNSPENYQFSPDKAYEELNLHYRVAESHFSSSTYEEMMAKIAKELDVDVFTDYELTDVDVLLH